MPTASTSSFLDIPRHLLDVYGSGIVVCARPAVEIGDPAGTHRLSRDVLSARPIAIAAGAPVICSAGGTNPTLLAAMREGGLPVGTDLREFRSEAEYIARVREAAAEGLRISMEYPQGSALLTGFGSIKSAQLVGHLNNKAGISTLVDPRFRARRTIVSLGELAAATPQEKSWVLKAATDQAHGASLDVYLHQAGEPIVLPAFTDRLVEFVIEDYLRIRRNWGIQLSIAPDATARLFAVTEQRINRNGLYTGGRFGLVDEPPAELLAECVAVAQRAADAGYRGLCSLDCVQTIDGQLALLDLNFRITSGSIPLLALRSVRPDALDAPAESTTLVTAAPLEDLLTALRPALDAGGVIVTAGHTTSRTDNPDRSSTVQLLVLGDDPNDVTSRRIDLETRFAA
ncbi:hypothetical protein WEH80_13625 [Actinomycetes bacterium KLBMP 9759]